MAQQIPRRTAMFGAVALGLNAFVNGSEPRSAQPAKTAPALSGPQCAPPGLLPRTPWAGLTYANWTFGIPDINEIRADFTINRLPDAHPNTRDADPSAMYFQAYDSSLDGTGQYFGVQGTGTMLFSQMGTLDESRIVLGRKSRGQVRGPFPGDAKNEGAISVRALYPPIERGGYTAIVRRIRPGDIPGTKPRKGGDWFEFLIAAGATVDSIGAMWFPRRHPEIPAAFADGGGSWTEFWPNNKSGLTKPYTPSHWRFQERIRANRGRKPIQAVTAYSTMPDSDITVRPGSGIAIGEIGGNTPRCHPAMTYELAARPPASTPSTIATPAIATPVIASPVIASPSPTATA